MQSHCLDGAATSSQTDFSSSDAPKLISSRPNVDACMSGVKVPRNWFYGIHCLRELFLQVFRALVEGKRAWRIPGSHLF